jgi:hypothetical protein
MVHVLALRKGIKIAEVGKVHVTSSQPFEANNEESTGIGSFAILPEGN